MQKHMSGWLSCWLYSAGALIFTYAAVVTRNWEFLLHVLAMVVLLYHALMRGRHLHTPHYLISLEKIHTRQLGSNATDLQEQIKDMAIDSVPLLVTGVACLLGYTTIATMIWFFLCVYKFAVQSGPSSRDAVVPLGTPGITSWMSIFFIILIGFTAAIAYIQPGILEAGVALLFVVLLVAIQHNIAWLYLSPAIVLLLVFTVWPIINTVRLAFLNDYNSLTAVNQEEVVTFNIGIDNFKAVFGYEDFLIALRNTALLTVITVPVSTLLALLIAVALNSIKPLQKFFQTVFFLPYVTNSIAIGMVFAAMFNRVGTPQILARGFGSHGIVNDFLRLFMGSDFSINWINASSSYFANMVVLIIYIVWNALPFKILVLLGGLQSVNKQYYEAAKVDSTPRWRVFTRITVPLLSPMIAYVVITGFIGGFKEYSSIVGIFGDTMGPTGDPGRLNTIVGMIYDVLPKQDYGLASAAALVLFAIIFVVTMINMQVSKKRVHY